MALFLPNSSGGGGGTILHTTAIRTDTHTFQPRRLQFILSVSPRRASLHIVSANKFSSRSGRFDSKNRRSSTTTTDQEVVHQDRSFGIKVGDVENEEGGVSVSGVVDDGFVMPKLPGDELDFWEGPQWDALGFFVQHLWAFGIIFALIACGIVVATYNQGATDFKETPIYKESIKSGDMLEEPEGSNSDMFESNPTESSYSKYDLQTDLSLILMQTYSI
ncbi:hypothetical protein K2173_001673 [Erythroxylum novogranatense]|uniref:Uncharacterized protein n=1 Tax=Erythroxylum novogranatense TaxID=1862640 RepID=A0AAV8T5N4_9ROSI|nr:hypothetical protein K2173_001673 [Erythroxylum novogranatense]